MGCLHWIRMSLLRSLWSMWTLTRRLASVLCILSHRVPSIILDSFPRRRVIIYSHANATDIGAIIPLTEMLGTVLDCDYVIYDYEGYGCSDGVAHGSNLPRDLRCVYDYVRTLFAGKDIYLAGESSSLSHGIIGSWECSHLLCGIRSLQELWSGEDAGKESGNSSCRSHSSCSSVFRYIVLGVVE